MRFYTFSTSIVALLSITVISKAQPTTDDLPDDMVQHMMGFMDPATKTNFQVASRKGAELGRTKSPRKVIHFEKAKSLDEATKFMTQFITNNQHIIELELTGLGQYASNIIPLLAGFPVLQALIVRGDIRRSGPIGVTEAQLIAQHLPRLTSLDIAYNPLTDAGVKEIATMPALTSLNVTKTNLTDEGIKAIATMHNLTSLNVSNNYKLTIAGLQSIATMPKLTSLNLALTFPHYEAEVQTLTTMRNLISLNVKSVISSPGGKEELTRSLPHTHIIF